MVYVQATGARFHLVELGPSCGGPVVMLHGLFTGSAASWYFTAAPAIARTRPVRLIDWRGHGLSECTPTGYDSATMVADLNELTCDLPPFAIAGHSYGAVVAVWFALAHPGRVTRLALVEPPFSPAPDRAVDLIRVPARCPRSTRMLLERTSVLHDLAAEPPITESELGRLTGLPVLSVTGTRSPFRATAQLIGRALPGARQHLLGGGHDLHISAKARLTPLLREFLAATPPGEDVG